MHKSTIHCIRGACCNVASSVLRLQGCLQEWHGVMQLAAPGTKQIHSALMPRQFHVVLFCESKQCVCVCLCGVSMTNARLTLLMGAAVSFGTARTMRRTSTAEMFILLCYPICSAQCANSQHFSPDSSFYHSTGTRLHHTRHLSKERNASANSVYLN